MSRNAVKVFFKGIATIGLLFALSTPLQAVEKALETALVDKITDGDTLKVIYRGDREGVRLIGIDTPESRKNAKAKKDARRSGEDVETITALGKKATAYTKSLVKKGYDVRLEFDVQKRDKYGRLLAYVYLKDGRMLNEEIIKGGYASPMTLPPNVKYAELFQEAYKKARARRRGLWK